MRVEIVTLIYEIQILFEAVIAALETMKASPRRSLSRITSGSFRSWRHRPAKRCSCRRSTKLFRGSLSSVAQADEILERAAWLLSAARVVEEGGSTGSTPCHAFAGVRSYAAAKDLTLKYRSRPALSRRPRTAEQ